MGLKDFAQQRNQLPGTGLGVALGLGLCGLGTWQLVPEYLEASSGWSVFWNAVGLLLGVIAIAGSLTELEGKQRHGLGDIGVGALLIGCGLVMNRVLSSTTWPTAVDTVGKYLVMPVVAVGLVGVAIGVCRFAAGVPLRREERQRRAEERSGDVALSFLAAATALVGLLTAVVNLWQVTSTS